MCLCREIQIINDVTLLYLVGKCAQRDKIKWGDHTHPIHPGCGWTKLSTIKLLLFLMHTFHNYCYACKAGLKRKTPQKFVAVKDRYRETRVEGRCWVRRADL